MNTKLIQQIQQKLAAWQLPSTEAVIQINELAGNAVQLKFPLCEKIKQILQADLNLNLDCVVQPESHIARAGMKAIVGIKSIIGVASGKGGVGKSTVAINLALALAEMGVRVGLLDADIYGPSQPQMLGVRQKPQLTEAKKLIPIERHGLKTMSMGYLVEAATPMAWRGPMISSALNQLLKDTEWGELDYLIVDLPPGTGDIQLTLIKETPLSAAVIVTTPQEVALLDARKAAGLFVKMSVPILGVIENMTTHICSHCGHAENLFGAGGGERLAQELKIPLLAQIPLHTIIQSAGDCGVPMKNQELNEIFALAATRMAAHLAVQKKSYQHLFNNIKIEN